MVERKNMASVCVCHENIDKLLQQVAFKCFLLGCQRTQIYQNNNNNNNNNNNMHG